MSCREVPKIGRNWTIGGAAVSCQELPRNGRDGERIGAAASCQELAEMGRDQGIPAAMRCHKISEMRGGYEGMP